MKLTVKGLQTLKGMGYINLVVPIPLSEEAEINKIDPEKQYVVEVKQKRKDRSLIANAALWVLLGEMAAKLRTSKDELYMEMLSRYGVFTQTGIQLQCYFGSSTYDTQEFTRLLDGVISEARELGITLISDADRALMLAEWGQKDDSKNKADTA